MKDFWWKLPVLRGLSPMQRGLLEAFGVTAFIAGLFWISLSPLFNNPAQASVGWVPAASALLGLWIAFQPWAMYEWTHAFNTEYPDE